MNGRWIVDHVADVDGKVLRKTSFVAAPPEPVADQEFQIVGRLSSMYARWFVAATSDGEHVTALQATVDPGTLKSLIPHDFSSDRLQM